MHLMIAAVTADSRLLHHSTAPLWSLMDVLQRSTYQDVLVLSVRDDAWMPLRISMCN